MRFKNIFCKLIYFFQLVIRSWTVSDSFQIIL